MNTLQTKAFGLAKRSLNPTSKFYKDDLADLKSHYSKMSDSKCREAIARNNATAELTPEYIAAHCQLDGLL